MILSPSSSLLIHLNACAPGTARISALRGEPGHLSLTPHLLFLCLFPLSRTVQAFLFHSLAGGYFLNIPFSATDMTQDQTSEELCYEDTKGELLEFKKYLSLSTDLALGWLQPFTLKKVGFGT